MGWKRKEPEGLEDTDHELGASAGPDLALWVCLQPPAAWRVQQTLELRSDPPAQPVAVLRSAGQGAGEGEGQGWRAPAGTWHTAAVSGRTRCKCSPSGQPWA